MRNPTNRRQEFKLKNPYHLGNGFMSLQNPYNPKNEFDPWLNIEDPKPLIDISGCSTKTVASVLFHQEIMDWNGNQQIMDWNGNQQIMDWNGNQPELFNSTASKCTRTTINDYVDWVPSSLCDDRESNDYDSESDRESNDYDSESDRDDIINFSETRNENGQIVTRYFERNSQVWFTNIESELDVWKRVNRK